ncbi:MAG: hypothetical protein LBK95_02770, partial [Bifidobacteriaceae bacterium]|nr:hypothetical protein [Bifidobacteriaceae bacterium]
MNRTKRAAVGLLAAGALALAGAVGAPQTGPAVAAPPPVGASFEVYDDLGVSGSRTYLYTPSEVVNALLTPVIFIYSDAGYADESAARAALENLGLVAKAEQEHAVLIVANPVGAEWGPADERVFLGMRSKIWSGIPTPETIALGTLALSVDRLDFVVGEGRGATFINQYLTQKPNVNRIAGVATFGGTMPAGVLRDEALPAYLTGASPAAVSFYKAVNQVQADPAADSTGSNQIFYNPANPAKEVVVNNADAARFTAALLDDAYETLFRYNSRQYLSTMVPYDGGTTREVFTLQKRPNLGALGLTQFDVTGAATGSTGQTRWVEWVPDEVLALPADSAAKVPLVIDLHGGGDDEVYQSESSGWIAVAGQERVIVVSPREQSAPAVTGLLAELQRKYPIDTTRVYLTGFSMGAASVWGLASQFPETFAAIAPMSAPGARITSMEGLADTLDLPVYFSAGQNEPDSIDQPTDTQPYPQLKQANRTALN